MKLCQTCGTPHPDDVTTSHHSDNCTCGSSLCGGSGPEGCIWCRVITRPIPSGPYDSLFKMAEYARLIRERDAATHQQKERIQ